MHDPFGETNSTQLVPEPIETSTPQRRRGRLAPLARVRVPITLTVRPWARLYELPDGRRLWCLRLWEGERPRTRCVTTARLRAYARSSGLAELERAIDDALRTAERRDG